MRNPMIEKLFKESGKALLTMGLTLAGYTVSMKACKEKTGDELKRIHIFEREGQKGIIVDRDTAYFVKFSAVTKITPKP